jgi:hypothetical protein
MQELLLHPPPRDTAAAISEACTLLGSRVTPAAGGLPQLEVVPPAKIAKLLRTREGSHVFFAELSAMAAAVARMLEHRSPDVR